MKKFNIRKMTSVTTALALLLSNFSVGFAANNSDNKNIDPVIHHFSQGDDYYEKVKQGNGISKYNPKERSTITFGQKGSALTYVGYRDGQTFKFPKKEVKGSGQLAYCIDHSKNVPASSGVSFSKYGELDAGAAYILAHNPNTGNADKDYYIKQGALHYYLGEAKGLVHATKGLDIRDKIIALANAAVTHKNGGSAKSSISVSNTSTNFTKNGNYYETPYINVSYTGNLQDYKITISGGPAGIEVLDQNGNVANTLPKTNTKFKLRIPVSSVSGSHTVNVNITGNYTNQVAEGYISSNSKLQRMIILVNKPETSNASLSAKIDGLGSLTVIKKDESGNKLQGAKFKLQQNGADVSEVKTSDANGVVKFENINLGTYQLIEVSAPQGYVIATASQNVNVTSTSTSIEVVNNKIKGKVRILKVDTETKAPLAGAVFELKDAAGTTIEKLTTDKDGVATSNLHPYGQYTVVEVAAPGGYLIDSTPHKVNISNNMESVQITANNQIIKGKVAVQKNDSEIKDLKLEGVEFTIYNKAGDIVDVLKTNKDGYAESKLLNYGTYTMKETKALEGYKPQPEKVYNIEIKENNKVYKYDVTNNIIKGKIQIVKIDSQNEEAPVKGAGFDVIADKVPGVKQGTVVEHIVTDENGFAFTKDLRYGTYKIKETKTPSGFWVSNKEYVVDIQEENKLYVRFIKNDPIQAKLRIIKTDGTTKQKLEGVQFKLVNKETNEDVIFKEYVDGKVNDKVIFTTDKNGEILLPQPLKTGKYSIVEVEAKEGYILAEPIDITIDENTEMEDIEAIGTVTSQWIENQRVTGKMELQKIDAETKKPLANVEFKVECIEGFDKEKTYQLITGEDGKASLEGLPFGKYNVIEVKTLQGYVLSTEAVPFEIKSNGETVTLTIENQFIKGEIEIIKTDSKTNDKLKGAEFTISDSEGKEVAKLITDENGYAKSEKLPYGFYQMKETKAPEGYQLSDKVIEINISENNKVYKYEITNDSIPAKLSKIEVLKIDSKTKQTLKGVVFQLINSEKKVIGEGTTNKDGIVIFENIAEGTYYLKEVKGLDGYIMKKELIKVNVGSDGAVVKITVENDPKLTQTGGIFNFNNMILIGSLTVISAIGVLVLEKKNKSLK